MLKLALLSRPDIIVTNVRYHIKSLTPGQTTGTVTTRITQLMNSSAVRHMVYEERGGYLLLPVVIMTLLGSTAVLLPVLEKYDLQVARWAAHASWLVPSDPGMAQLLLGAIAGSCITVVSVVYSVLLIALTFASIQFSPRILTSFLKDRVSQGTLGIFIGTFSYCLVLLPSIHGGSRVVVPTLSLSFALLLATVCLLVFDLLHSSHCCGNSSELYSCTHC